MNRFARVALPVLALGVLVPVVPTSAHHSFAMFDTTVRMYLEGTVENWAFNNPHSWLYIRVAGANGESTLWGFEGAAPPSLVRRGIVGNTYEPGDVVKVVTCPLRDGRPGGHLSFVVQEDGSTTTPNDAPCAGGPTLERWKAEGWLDAAKSGDTHPWTDQ